MPARTPTDSSLPAAVSVTEMARRLGLSRSRFYDLVADGVFPMPVYCVFTHRPMYLTTQVVDCLKVKQTNIGVNGRYCLFYSPRQDRETVRPAARSARAASSQQSRHAHLLEGLQALGMASVTEQQVDAALQECFPDGWAGRDEGEVLRSLWQRFRRSNAG